MDVDSFSPDATGSQRPGWRRGRRGRRGRHRFDVLTEDARAARTERFLLARLAPGILLTLSCVALNYATVLHMTDAWRPALVITLVLTGAPLAFLAIRLVICLAAHRQGRRVNIWPPDGSIAVNFGLTLLVVNMLVAGIMTAGLLDDWLFDGRVMAFLERYQS